MCSGGEGVYTSVHTHVHACSHNKYTAEAITNLHCMKIFIHQIHNKTTWSRFGHNAQSERGSNAMDCCNTIHSCQKEMQNVERNQSLDT